MILYYIFVLTLPFVAHPWFGIGFAEITVEKVVAAAAIAYAVVHLALREKKPVLIDTWPARAFLVFFLLALGSSVFAEQPIRADQLFVFHPFNSLLLFFMTVSVVDTIPRLRWTLLAAVGSVAWALLYMLRGEDLETLSRKYAVTAATLSSWRDGFLADGEASLKIREDDPVDAQGRRMKSVIAELAMTVELQRERIQQLENSNPSLKRRSKR
jgi:transposase